MKMEYRRLKECFLFTVSPFHIIHKNIMHLFTLKLNPKTAKKIIQLFNNIIEESGFEDLEQIKDDIVDQDINDSQILLHIISNIDIKNVQTKLIIYNGIKAIINDDIDSFLEDSNNIDVKSQVCTYRSLYLLLSIYNQDIKHLNNF